MPIAANYETHRHAVFPVHAAHPYLSVMSSIGRTAKEMIMTKWIIVSTVIVVIAIGAALCFRAATAADVGPGVFTGASGHKASGHVEIVKDGETTKVVFKDEFTLQDAPAPRLAWGKDGYKRGTIFATLAKFKGTQE